MNLFAKFFRKNSKDVKTTAMLTEITKEIAPEDKAEATKIVELVVNMIAEKQYKNFFLLLKAKI